MGTHPPLASPSHSAPAAPDSRLSLHSSPFTLHRLRGRRGIALVLAMLLIVVASAMIAAVGGEAVQWSRAVANQAKTMDQKQILYSTVSRLYSQFIATHELTGGIQVTGYESALAYIKGDDPTKDDYWAQMVTQGSGEVFTDLTVKIAADGSTENIGKGFLIRCDVNADNYSTGTYRVRNSVDVRIPKDPALPLDPEEGNIERTILDMGLTVEVCRVPPGPTGCDTSVDPETCDVVFTMTFMSPFDFPIFVDDYLNWGPAGSVNIAAGTMEIDEGFAYFGKGAYDPNDIIDIDDVFYTPKEQDVQCPAAGSNANCVLDKEGGDPDVHGGDWPEVLNNTAQHDIDNHTLRIPFPEACKFLPGEEPPGNTGRECYKPFADRMNCIDNCKDPPGCTIKFDEGGADGKLSCSWDDNGNTTIDSTEPYTDDTDVSAIGAGWAWTAVYPTYTPPTGTLTDSDASAVPNIVLGCNVDEWATMALNLTEILPPPLNICWATDDGVATGTNVLKDVIINGNLDLSGRADECVCLWGGWNCQGVGIGNCVCEPCTDCGADGCELDCSPVTECCWVPCFWSCGKTAYCGFEIDGTVVVKGNATFRNRFYLRPGAKLYVMGDMEILDANLSDRLGSFFLALLITEGEMMLLDVSSRKFGVWTKENSTIYVRGDAFIKGADIGTATEFTLGVVNELCSVLDWILDLFGLSCPTPAPLLLLGPRPDFGGETNVAGTILDDSLILVRGLRPTIRDTNTNGQLADENVTASENNDTGGYDRGPFDCASPDDSGFSCDGQMDVNVDGYIGDPDTDPHKSTWHGIRHYDWRTDDLNDLVVKAGGLTRVDLHEGRDPDASAAYSNPSKRGDLCCHAPCDKGTGTTTPYDFADDSALSLSTAINMTPIEVPSEPGHVHYHAFDEDPGNNNCDDSNACAAISEPAANANCQANYQDRYAEQFFAESNNTRFAYWDGTSWVNAANLQGGCDTDPHDEDYWGYTQPVFKGHADLELWSYGAPCVVGMPWQNAMINGTVFSMGSFATNQTVVGLGNIVSMGPQVYPEHLTSLLVDTTDICDDGYSFTKDEDHSFNVISGTDLFSAQGLGLESFLCGTTDWNGVCAFALTLFCWNTGLFDGNPNYGVVYSNGKAGYEESNFLDANAIVNNGNVMVRHVVAPEEVWDWLDPFCQFFGFSCAITMQPCWKINTQLCQGKMCRYDDKLKQLGFPVHQLTQLVSVVFNSPM
ncbi:MAG: hypothetical protein HYY13_09795 [Nitrospirae bacterium]|nr:hypothetical protein [Nitrospirota bacterium]